ncbi:MAG TPA: CsbD family protein [Usitatibacter sp.]|jgi:uncharacterized protein YjbJ (UPF0337 family)|nr:CsbD family protein [Usitatibacter sp.]
MNKDQMKGSMKEAGGKVEKAAGDLTDNTSQKLKGVAHEAEGKVQKKFGDVKQDVEESSRENRDNPDQPKH